MILRLTFSILVSLALIGCVGEESPSNSNNTTQGYEVTLSGDWISGASVVDSNNQKAIYKGKGVYVFKHKPQGSITLSGGRFEKTHAINKMVMTIDANTRILSPINSFLYENPHLKDKVFNALSNSSTDNQTIDKQTLSNTSKVIYLMASNNVLSPFTRSLNNVQNYNDIVRSAQAAGQQSNNSALINASLALITLSFFDITNKADIAKITSENSGIARRYVTESGAGDKTGLNWQNAFDKAQLQQAINDVERAEGEVWIAKGTYKPSKTDKTISFELKNGVKLYGGFSGNETSLDARNIRVNKTILSGDIDNNDRHKSAGITPTYRYIEGTNSLAIISLIDSASSQTRLDGLYISGGESTESNLSGGLTVTNSTINIENVHFIGNTSTFYSTGANSNGGALIANNSTVKIKNTVFKGNASTYGGAISSFASAASPTNISITGCTFENNQANYGGGISNRNSIFNIVDSTFKRNKSSHQGGAIFNEDVAVRSKISNVAFVNNSSNSKGGAIYNKGSSYLLDKITFSGNFASNGGAMFNTEESNVRIKNTTFSYNLAYVRAGGSTLSNGGGLYNYNSAPIIINSTFYNNHAFAGAAMFTGQITTNKPMIVNSILWNNKDNYNRKQYMGEINDSHNHIESPILTTNPRLVKKSKIINGVMHTYYELGRNISSGLNAGEHRLNNTMINVTDEDQIGISRAGSAVYKGAIQAMDVQGPPARSQPFVKIISISHSNSNLSIELGFSEKMKFNSQIYHSSILIENENGQTVPYSVMRCSNAGLQCNLSVTKNQAVPLRWYKLKIKKDIQSINNINLNREYIEEFQAYIQ